MNLEITEKDRAEAIRAHYSLQSVRQTIGVLGWQLRRTKPGSERHEKYYLRLLKLERQAEELSVLVVRFMRMAVVP